MNDPVFDTADRLFGNAVDKALLDAAEAGTFPADLWRSVEDTGLTQALDESGDFATAASVLRAAGRHAVPLPIAETLLARHLLARAGQDLPDGPLSLAFLDGAAARDVAWARRATTIVALVGDQVALIDPAAADIRPGRNLAGEPRDILASAPATTIAAAPIDAEALRRLGAWSRAVLMQGAMEKALEIATGYANDRVQFGRPIGKQQAIQHQLALMAEEVAAAGVAAQLATQHIDGPDAFLAIAAAKIRCGEAAGKAAEYAHQTLGAIGFTHEHTLHHLTRRLWSWRDEYGRESEWSMALGRHVGTIGGERLWHWLTQA
ncbi:MAG: acyl-CoA dehydrogenase family protein [Alphaproteobacteria bacterium]